MEYRGFVVHAFDRVRGGRTEIDLIGRLSGGETFAIVERRWRPLLLIREAELPRARPVLSEREELEVLESDRRTMDGAPTLRIEAPTSALIRWTRDALHGAGVRTYEADVKLCSQLLMDRGIHGALTIRGEPRRGHRVSYVFQDPEIEAAPASPEPRLSVLSLDIETDRAARGVFCVGLAFRDPEGGTSREVLFRGEGAREARCFPGERELLGELRSRVLALDPDIITGWNVVDFDLRTLHRRAGELGVRFDVGRSDSPATFLDRSGGDGGPRFKRSRVIVDGRQVVDALWLVRLANLGLEDYRLETVARALVGRGKLIERRGGESAPDAIERLYREDPTALCAYCGEDAFLVLDILGAEGFLDVAIQKSLLIGTPLDQTWASVASFELLYMEHLHRRGMVAPTLGVDQEPVGTSPGGGIITSRAGIYDTVLAFDYKSLYPSIMRTFNIDPLTRVPREEDGTAPELLLAPNGARFRRESGILPEILARFFESRAQARKQGNERSSYAYKIVMNSFYGVLGTGGCRFASPDLAGAITTFGQHFLFWTRDFVTARGYEVIYGDTDSIFIRSGYPRDAAPQELEALGAQLCAAANAAVAEYVRGRWGVESRLELEFEAVYLRFFMPPMRTPTFTEEEGEEGESRGRAKGYAGLRLERGAELLEIKGMEAVRHDWTELAHSLQRDLLDWVFHDVSAPEITSRVRAFIAKLRAGELDGSLVYRKALRKPVEEYTKSQPPHAKAALLLPPEERSGVIRYVLTTEGPQPESRRTAAPDYDHYVQKQLEPIVESVAPYAGLDARVIFEKDRQLDLFGGTAP